MNEVVNINNITIQDVYKEIMNLGKDIRPMREEIADRFLSPEEEILLEEALKEHKDGITISLADFEKESVLLPADKKNKYDCRFVTLERR